MDLRFAKYIFAILVVLKGANALTCSSNTLKITIKTLPEEYEFDIYEQYEMRATIAYSIQKYCGEETASDGICSGEVYIIAENVTLTNITERISMCVEVTTFGPDFVRAAIKVSKANLNGALILTDEDLFVEGILPTLSPVPIFDFPPWIIAYIVIFGLIILGGVIVLLYSKFHKSDHSDDKESILEDEELGAGNVNDGYAEEVNIVESNHGEDGYAEEVNIVESNHGEDATAL